MGHRWREPHEDRRLLGSGHLDRSDLAPGFGLLRLGRYTGIQGTSALWCGLDFG